MLARVENRSFGAAGNDSVLATKLLRVPAEKKADVSKDAAAVSAEASGAIAAADAGSDDSAGTGAFLASNIAGGLVAWSKHVDSEFPVY